jgi:nicotinamidase-related amidase
MRTMIPWEDERSGGRFSIREWDIAPERTALLVLDLQRGYVEREMGIGPRIQAKFPDVSEYYYPRMERTVVPNVVRLQDFFRARGVQIIYTRMGLQLPDGRDVADWSWRRQHTSGEYADLFAKSTPEHDLIAELSPTSNDLTLDKNSVSPFSSTAIDQILRNMGVENLIIAGATTNAAVETTARDAGDRGYCPIVVEDGVAAYLADDHDGAMKTSTWWVAKRTQDIVNLFEPFLKEGTLVSRIATSV